MTTNRPNETIRTNQGIIPKPTIANFSERMKGTGSHDEFFKEVLSDLDTARRFLEWVLRRDGSRLPIDLTRLQTQPEAMRGRTLKKLFADVLLKAPVQTTAPDGSTVEVPVYIFFLLEHKSFNDPMTALQILRYQVEVWTRIDDERRKNNDNRLPLPFILPIIVHHGVGSFTSSTNLRDMIAPVEGLESFLPSFPCDLVDVEAMKKEEYPQDWDLNAFFAALKTLSSKNIVQDLDEILHKITPYLGNKASEHFLEILVLYILKNNRARQQKEWKNMSDVLGQVYSKDTIDELAPWWVKVKAEGKAEGRAEGKAEGKAEGRAEGVLIGRREALVNFLKARFGEVPPEAREKINSVTAVSQLDELIARAANAAAWEDFSAHLPAAEAAPPQENNN